MGSGRCGGYEEYGNVRKGGWMEVCGFGSVDAFG